MTLFFYLGRVKGIESLVNYQRRSLLSKGYVMTNQFKTHQKYGYQVPRPYH